MGVRKGPRRAAGIRRSGRMKTRTAALGAPPRSREVVPRAKSDLPDVRCLETLGPPGDVELEPLSFGERLETLALNRGEMHEHVLTALLGDETKTLRLVE